MDSRANALNSQANRLVALLMCIGAAPPHVWNSLFSLPDWAGWLSQFCALGAALYLLWRRRAVRKYILFWFVAVIAVVGTFGWLQGRT